MYTELNQDKIFRLLEALDAQLAVHSLSEIEIILVGGAALAIKGLRNSTYDIDFFLVNGIRKNNSKESLDHKNCIGQNAPSDEISIVFREKRERFK